MVLYARGAGLIKEQAKYQHEFLNLYVGMYFLN